MWLVEVAWHHVACHFLRPLATQRSKHCRSCGFLVSNMYIYITYTYENFSVAVHLSDSGAMRWLLSNLSLKCKLQSTLHTTATPKKWLQYLKLMLNFHLTMLWSSTLSRLRLEVKFHTMLVQQSLGSIRRHSASVSQAGSHGEKLTIICHGLQLRRTRFSSNFFIEIAESGFPDTKQYLRECINTLLQAKKGDLTFFVGVNWVDCWLECHKGHLQKYWNTSLNRHHASAVNPTTVSDYFLKLQKILTEHAIKPDCLWSMDETGLQFNHTPKKQVIGQAGQHQQHSIQHGSQEFATIIPLISAAGVCPPPTVIFQGVQMKTTWTGEGNPLNTAWVSDSNLILCIDCMQASDVC